LRVGIGYDIHKYAKGRKLILGGVQVPYSKGLAGHSDGDALIHAIIDALLGALGLPDIGEQFPNTSKAYAGISSVVLLKKTLTLVSRRGYTVQNIDSVILAEAPKMKPFKEKIRQSLAKIMKVSAGKLNIKAKTMEGMGPIGQKKALSVHCIVALKKKRK